MTKRAPYKAGDTVNILRDERDRGTVWGPLTITRVDPQNDWRHPWRLTATRNDGTDVQVYVDAAGRDAHGYVEPTKASA